MTYTEVLQELGITQKQMDDAKAILLTPMLSNEESNVYFGHSSIEGNGAFAIKDIRKDDYVAPLRKNDRWTLTGMMTNHSEEPNTRCINGDLIASGDIAKHSELTVDYLQIKEELP